MKRKNDTSYIPPVAGYLGPFGFDYQNPSIKIAYAGEPDAYGRAPTKTKSITLHAVRCANLRLIFNNPSIKELFTEFEDYNSINECFAYLGLNIAPLFKGQIGQQITLSDKILAFKEGVNDG